MMTMIKISHETTDATRRGKISKIIVDKNYLRSSTDRRVSSFDPHHKNYNKKVNV